jgi:hypothetical protein
MGLRVLSDTGITLSDVLNLILGNGGLLVMLLVILYGGSREDEWWVFGRIHREMKADYERRLTEKDAAIEEWKDIAMPALSVAERIVERPAPSQPLALPEGDHGQVRRRVARTQATPPPSRAGQRKGGR